MNPLPLHGTKILGGTITLGGFIDLLVQLTTPEVAGVVTSLAGKYAPAILTTLAGLLVIARGFQNTANNEAMGVVPQTKNKISGFAYVNFLVCLIALSCTLEMVACAAQATKAAPTFNQLVVTASSVDDTVVNLTKSLYDQKVLTTQQVRAVVAITGKIQAALTLANTAFVAGDQTSANTGLLQASQAIAGVQVCLTNPATLLTCLQSVNPPTVN
jgi:hypothetical protein